MEFSTKIEISENNLNTKQCFTRNRRNFGQKIFGQKYFNIMRNE